MKQTTLCYILRGEECLLLHRNKNKQDGNDGKWLGIGGKFEENESPEDCVCREVLEETGLVLEEYAYRGVVTFVSDCYDNEMMHIFTATAYSGDLIDCEEGELMWRPFADLYTLPHWAGDDVFHRLLEENAPFFSLKLVYEGERLVSARVNGENYEIEGEETMEEELKFGFIGVGTMGSAVAITLAKAVGENAELYFSGHNLAKANELSQLLEGKIEDNLWIAEHCDAIFLGVKPQMLGEVLAEIAPVLEARDDYFTLVSMVAGVSIAQIQQMAGRNYAAIRIMPNTPMTVGAGMVQICGDVAFSELNVLAKLLAASGKVDIVPEAMMDAATAVSGCGPAYCAMLVEALADGGVQCGLPREKALLYAAQTLVGTGELLLQKEMHPGALKDGVCSPGGATIRGVYSLEKNGFRAAGMEAVVTAFEASQALGK